MFPIDDEDETADLTPEERAALHQTLRQKYEKAADDSDVEAAQARARRGDMVGDAFQGLGDYFMASSVARGGPGMKDITSGIQASNAQRVADARQARKSRMDDVLKGDELDWQDKERARREGDWGFQDKERTRKEGEWARDDAAKGREDDPTSMESETARALAKKMMPQGDFTGMSATQLKGSLPSLEKLYTAEQQRLGRIDALNAAAAARQDATQARHDEKEEQRNWKEEQVKKANDEKKKATLNEIEDRRTNINQNLDVLDKMIEENGTWEAVGSHNQDLDRLVDQVATDMAKLQDPNSVARPSEVDAVKRNLIKSGFGNSNATARDIINHFREEVKRRADGAYKIRGIENPNAFPRTIRKGTQTATVSNAQEFSEAQAEGWE